MRTRYYLRLPEPAKARGSDPELAFHSEGAEGLAGELQQALRETQLFDAWRGMQEDPDAVDPGMGVIDPSATVTGQQSDLVVELVVNTDLPGSIFKHRLRLLAGNGWEMRDVRAG